MMDFSNILFTIFNGLLEVYIICFFFSTFVKQKEFKDRNIILALLSVAFITTLYTVKIPALNFIILMVVVFLISLLYKAKWYNHIFLILAFMVLGALAELVVAIASSYILKVDMPTLKTGFYFVIGTILSKFLTFAIIAIIRRGKHNLPIGNLKGMWVYISLLQLVSVILIIILSDYMYTIVDNPLKQTICILSTFLLIVVNILLFYVIDKMINSIAKEQELKFANQLIESQKKTYRELYDSQTEIKKLRHDLKNVMIGILHEISNDNIENAKAHIEKQCELLDATSGFVSGNSIIDTLINIKKETADSVGVTLSVDTQLSHQIGIDSIDLVVLLGNALDNAIEAAAKCTSHTKAVDVVIITKNSNLLIVVKNPIEDAVDINNLVTTKTEKNAHGFGVLQMQSLAQKYGGEVLLDCNESEFKTTVILSNSVNE